MNYEVTKDFGGAIETAGSPDLRVPRVAAIFLLKAEVGASLEKRYHFYHF